MSEVLTYFAPFYSRDDTRYVFMDGRACKSLESCYTTLRLQLSLPDYFGNNLDALDEVLADLEWIKEGKIMIILLNVSEMLTDDFNRKKDFLEVLNSSENEKLTVIYLGEE